MYKTIFCPLTQFKATSPELKYAMALADSLDAHLEVMCLGVDHTPNTYFEIGSNAVMMQTAIEEAHGRADALRQSVGDHLKNSGLRWSAVKSVSSAAGLGRIIAAQARFSDVAVVGKPYGEDASSDGIFVIEGLLFESDVPVIVVPKAEIAARPKQIVVAWDESTEALRAIRAALPFLASTDSVHIAIIDPSDSGPERSDPGGALAAFLARHDVDCDIQVMARQGMTTAQRLLKHVTESGSDMLVMGGYGHSRLREAVLGGATRDMLEHGDVPVLMAH